MNFRLWLEMKPIWLDDLEDAGGRIESDGTVIVYHGTTAEKAEKIVREKVLRRPADAPDSYGVYFAAGAKAAEFVAESYGEVVVPMRVRASDLHIEDLAHGAYATFYARTIAGIYRPISIGKPFRP